jgi:hypothetical protein
MYAAGDSMWNHVSPETRKLVEQFCEQNQFPAREFATLTSILRGKAGPLWWSERPACWAKMVW